MTMMMMTTTMTIMMMTTTMMMSCLPEGRSIEWGGFPLPSLQTIILWVSNLCKVATQWLEVDSNQQYYMTIYMKIYQGQINITEYTAITVYLVNLLY
jgi:hypothetical protein